MPPRRRGCSEGPDEGALREEPGPHPARIARHPLPLRRRGDLRMTGRKAWNAANTAPDSAEGRTSTGIAPRHSAAPGQWQCIRTEWRREGKKVVGRVRYQGYPM